MVRITTIKINIGYLKTAVIISTILLLFIMLLFILLSQNHFNNIINKVDTSYFIKAMDSTLFFRLQKVGGSVSKTEINKISNMVGEVSAYITGFSLKNPDTIINSQISALKQYGILQNELLISENSFINTENIDDSDLNYPSQITDNNLIEQAEVKPIENISSSKGITLINETKYKIDLKSMISTPLILSSDKTSPLVLIYHTHTCESYTPSDKYKYTPTDNDRTTDINYNMVKVGEELANTLKNKYGIGVIHDQTLHDRDEYNSSYTKSVLTVQKYLKKYPNISMVIDIHRDALSVNGQKMKFTSLIDGEPTARVMTVVGTDSRGLPHPKWRNNLKLGAAFADTINNLYPGLSRGVNLKLGRFNQYVSQNSILIEVGSNGNTLDEAINSTKRIAHVIAVLLKNK